MNVFIRNDTPDQAIRASNLPTFALVVGLFDGNVIFKVDWIMGWRHGEAIWFYGQDGLTSFSSLPVDKFTERFTPDFQGLIEQY